MDTIKHKLTRERNVRHTAIIESKTFIGLLYLASVAMSNRQTLAELWGYEDDSIEKICSLYGYKTFHSFYSFPKF